MSIKGIIGRLIALAIAAMFIYVSYPAFLPKQHGTFYASTCQGGQCDGYFLPDNGAAPITNPPTKIIDNPYTVNVGHGGGGSTSHIISSGEAQDVYLYKNGEYSVESKSIFESIMFTALALFIIILLISMSRRGKPESAASQK